jgi:PAS domain S-box-containing protein/diguanylate cyclase (GGDEF)-like protein
MTQLGASTASLPSLPPRSLLRLSLATALLILFLAAATGAMLFVSYQDTLRQERTNLRNLSIAFSAQTSSVAQAFDHAMHQAERAYAAHGAHPRTPNWLDDIAANSMAQGYLLGISLYDSAGRLVASGTANRDKPAAPPSTSELRAAIDAKTDRLRIGISHGDPVTGHGVINFTRTLVDAGGVRTGIVIAQADSEQFERLYRLVELGPGGSVTLFNRDGTMLVRGPSYPSGIGRSFAHTPLFQHYLPLNERDAFSATSPLDGKARLYGYDAVSSYPLVIIAGVNRTRALAGWYGRAWTAMIFLALISMAVVFLAWRVAHEAARQSGLIVQLADSEARAENSAQYLASILNSVGTPIWVLDSARRIVMLNHAFSRFAGRARDQLVGLHEKDALDPDGAPERDQRYREVLDGAQTSEAITEITDGSGQARSVIQLSSRLLDEAGQAQIVSVLTDITERQEAERRLQYVADFDLLTGLPSHGQFRRVLQAEMAGAAARGGCVGVLLVSFERVPEITDLLGHEAGDSALKQIGELFQCLLPRAAVVARIKGNRFGVVIDAAGGRDFLAQYALELCVRLSGVLKVGEREFYPGPVIGVSIFPEDGACADDLFQHAYSALNRASVDVSNPIHFFSELAQADLDEQLAVEAQLRRALEREEFRLVYQPKVQIGSGRIVGFEALLRWSNPVLGDVSPVRFIPIAERTGLIIPIGAWVLQQACRQVNSWGRAGMHVKVAVNLSPRQFHQKELLPMIRACLQRCAILPGSLELEITEGALMSREQEVDVLMRDIRALGIELSIDDFGTGYSSLAYLKRLPVQRLKVDRAFICDLGKDDDSAAIVRAIVSLAHGLKLGIVAEGVETEQQLAILRSMGCDEYQGFLFSLPLEAGSVPARFEQNRSVLV